MSKGRRIVGVTCAALIIGALLVVVAVSLFFDSYRVASEASAPTLEPGDRLLASQADGDEVARGDLIVFVAPGEPVDGSLERVARVIGVSGDAIDQAGDSVEVNGEEPDEPYLPDGTPTDGIDGLTVPEGHVYVLGDNRINSQDSRFFGPVPAENVTGVVRFRWWPLSSIGTP